jgi:hypothetical protein
MILMLISMAAGFGGDARRTLPRSSLGSSSDKFFSTAMLMLSGG